MTVLDLVGTYRSNGFVPFPLKPMSKHPAVANMQVAAKQPFTDNNNIGLFAGYNHLVVVDADEPNARVFVENRLRALGLYDWTTIVRTPRRSLAHFWFRVRDVPKGAQAYYKLPGVIGGGEIRIHHPAYVVAPGSVIAEGAYEFIQGGVQFFVTQPMLTYSDLTWLLPQHALNPLNGRTQGSGYAVSVDLADYELPTFYYAPNPPVLRMFALLQAPKGKRIPKVNLRTGEVLSEKYPSRSEAEQALVMGLIRAGWNFGQILQEFYKEKPGHFMETPNPEDYLSRAFSRAATFIASRYQH